MNQRSARTRGSWNARTSDSESAPFRCFLALATLGLFFTLPIHSASAISFQIDFVESNYVTQAGDTFMDLLAAHQAGTLIQSNQSDVLENISTAVYAGGTTEDYSILMTTTLRFTTAGTYTFQVGTDWGRGGAAALIDTGTGTVVSEVVQTEDIWWANDWNNSDVFANTFDFIEGDEYTLAWVGFEGCCGGSTTVRFSVDGSEYQNLTAANMASFAVPEPTTALLLGLGLGVLARFRRPAPELD